MLTNNQSEFIKFVKKECRKYGVKVELRNVNYLKMSGNIHCSGYFDSENKLLIVAKKHTHWFETLAHEYSHLTQWVEGCPAWVNGIESIDIIDRWIGGEDTPDVQTHLKLARELELDNEKRTVDIILKWGLDDIVDVGLYTKKANAYVIFYNWLGISRRWSNVNNSPYKNQRLMSAMSSKFDMDYDTMDPTIEKIFVEENI
jgi:hypothetical protein